MTNNQSASVARFGRSPPTCEDLLPQLVLMRAHREARALKNPRFDEFTRDLRAFGEHSFERLIRPLFANLHAGVRTAFFLRVDSKSWEVSSGLLIALIVTSIVLGIALNRTFYSGPVEFNWSEL